MKCLWFSEVYKELNGSRVDLNIVENEDFTDKWLVNAITSIKGDSKKNIIEALQTVGNMDINDILPETMRYKVGDKILSMTELATSEFIFLVGELSRIYNIRIIIVDLVGQLDNRNLEKFLKRYGSEDIWIVLRDGKMTEYDNIRGCGLRLCVW